MSNVAERDFSNFRLGDNVYELAGGVIPETAEYFGMKLANEPNSVELGKLVGLIGPNKVLRENEEVTAIDIDTQVGLVDRSGVQKELSRSLWTPGMSYGALDAVVLTGAVANWQDRTVERLLRVDYLILPTTAYYVAGNRTMSGPSEVTNANVSQFIGAFGRYPTEFEYAVSKAIPDLSERGGYQVLASNPDTNAGDEIAAHLFREYPQLLEKNLVFARVANAGIQLAVQMRKAAQDVDPLFDSNPNEPQVSVVTDSFPVAKTVEEEAEPSLYQKAGPALRQMALTAKLLNEAAGGE